MPRTFAPPPSRSTSRHHNSTGSPVPRSGAQLHRAFGQDAPRPRAAEDQTGCRGPAVSAGAVRRQQEGDPRVHGPRATLRREPDSIRESIRRHRSLYRGNRARDQVEARKPAPAAGRANQDSSRLDSTVVAWGSAALLSAFRLPRLAGFAWSGGWECRDVAPRFSKDIAQQRRWHFGEAYENGGIVAVMVGEEERARVELHEHVPFADRGQLQHEHRVVIPKPREKPAIQEERRHSVGAALDHVGKLAQQAPGFGDLHAARSGPLHLFIFHCQSPAMVVFGNRWPIWRAARTI